MALSASPTWLSPEFAAQSRYCPVVGHRVVPISQLTRSSVKCALGRVAQKGEVSGRKEKEEYGGGGDQTLKGRGEVTSLRVGVNGKSQG